VLHGAAALGPRGVRVQTRGEAAFPPVLIDCEWPCIQIKAILYNPALLTFATVCPALATVLYCRPLAARGSLLYFTLVQLRQLDPMYCFSLNVSGVAS
jgi:hypothetical protein